VTGPEIPNTTNSKNEKKTPNNKLQKNRIPETENAKPKKNAEANEFPAISVVSVLGCLHF
jgi:hypothetical protein